jgi:biopolymer transport protein ExbB
MDHSQNFVTTLTVRLSMQGAAGWVMWFLVVLSVISLTIAVERYIFLTLNRGNVSVVQSALNKLMASGKTDEARKLLTGQRGLAATVVREGLEAMGRGRGATEEVMSGVTKAERIRYERGLAFLGTLGNNAPFIGLFGTVLEIIRSLHILSEKSGVGAGSVMSSLSEALAATAIGLLVALPAVATNNYFQRRIKIYAVEADALGNVLLAHISEHETTPAKAPAGG